VKKTAATKKLTEHSSICKNMDSGQMTAKSARGRRQKLEGTETFNWKQRRPNNTAHNISPATLRRAMGKTQNMQT